MDGALWNATQWCNRLTTKEWCPGNSSILINLCDEKSRHFLHVLACPKICSPNRPRISSKMKLFKILISLGLVANAVAENKIKISQSN